MNTDTSQPAVAPTRPNWREMIFTLPSGLTYQEAADKLGQPYSAAYKWLRRLCYNGIDGRKKRKPGISPNCKIDWGKVDWSKSPTTIARECGVSRQAVHAMIRRREVYQQKVNS